MNTILRKQGLLEFHKMDYHITLDLKRVSDGVGCSVSEIAMTVTIHRNLLQLKHSETWFSYHCLCKYLEAIVMNFEFQLETAAFLDGNAVSFFFAPLAAREVGVTNSHTLIEPEIQVEDTQLCCVANKINAKPKPNNIHITICCVIIRTISYRSVCWLASPFTEIFWPMFTWPPGTV